MAMQIAIAFTFGVLFVIVLLVLAIVFPKPTSFQYSVFRIVLSIAAAGVAAMIPGFINIELESTVGLIVRAGGALAVFVIVFFFNPARLAVHKETIDGVNNQGEVTQIQSSGDNSRNMQAGHNLNVKS